MIIVKNLNLPESCAECRFLAYDDYATGHEYECLALREFMNDDEPPEGRRSDCPIFDENVETIQSIVLIGKNGNAAEYAKTIRCEDCKFYGVCVLSNSEDGFCAWAKPKEKRDDR